MRKPKRKRQRKAKSPVIGADFLAAIVEQAGHPIFVKDRQGRYILVNRALARLVQRPASEILGKTDTELFRPDEAKSYRKRDSHVLAIGRALSTDEEQFTDREGKLHILSATKAPLRLGRNESHLLGILHDITEMREAKEALHRANRELDERVQQRTAELAAAQAELIRKQRLAVLGQLAGGLAHQIRNPLGAIVNAAALLNLELGTAASPSVMSALRVLHEEAWRADRIITDLIDYARVRQSLPVRAEARDLLEQALKLQDLGKHIRVVRRLPSRPLWVLVDPEQVVGALGNLLSNAVEAMPEGGELSLGAEKRGNRVRITISDTGTGIADNIRPQLFQPLVTSKPWGLGLGLPTARALVENQGGRLDCAKSTAEGTRFDVLLPSAR